MSLKSFDAFMSAIASRGTAVPEMVEVLRRMPPWEATSKKR
jgi:hypothetical protein